MARNINAFKSSSYFLNLSSALSKLSKPTVNSVLLLILTSCLSNSLLLKFDPVTPVALSAAPLASDDPAKLPTAPPNKPPIAIPTGPPSAPIDAPILAPAVNPPRPPNNPAPAPTPACRFV